MNSSGTWTVGHGLGVAPAVVLVKATGGTSDWWMWHHSLGGPTDGAKYIKFNSTAVSPANDSTVWNNTVPTSSVYSMGSNTWSASATVPDYQGIDQAKLVPLLVKTVQEQQVIIENLQSRVTTLEG